MLLCIKKCSRKTLRSRGRGDARAIKKGRDGEREREPGKTHRGRGERGREGGRKRGLVGSFWRRLRDITLKAKAKDSSDR